MLTTTDLSKSYGDFTALEDVNLEFSRGVYGLLAPNGAGKTTLIKLLTTLLFPTAGEILWNGEDIHALGEEYRAVLGYLPQEFGYYPGYSVTRFLQYGAALQRMDRASADVRISELLEMVGLQNSARAKMRTLSGGMRQRVGIAMAMLTDPELLILDEPTAGLDPMERVRFRDLIHAFAQDRTVILSTHIVSDVETIADEVILLKDHTVFCAAPPRDISAALTGRIWDIPADQPLSADQFVLSDRQGGTGPVHRIVSAYPPENGMPVAPGLEDAFLAIYGRGAQ